jgi:hypothetical protein
MDVRAQRRHRVRRDLGGRGVLTGNLAARLGVDGRVCVTIRGVVQTASRHATAS